DAARRAARARAQVPPSPGDEDGGLLSRLPAIDEGRGARWRRLLNHSIDALGERLPEQSKVESLWLELERGDQHLHLGPSTLDVRRTDQALELELIPQGETKGTPLAVQARLPRSEGPLQFK